ncbi:MAG: hypothetical protein EOM69_13440, partial [Clostridia bacterium]|nr:hypothetical protein [Clostridia bacterium]
MKRQSMVLAVLCVAVLLSACAPAADYIAGLFGALALAPLFDDYFQPYEDFVVYPERAEAKLAILSADGTRTEL